MNTHWLSLHAVSPVIATASSATVGPPESLPYVPGSQLLGCVAAGLYRQLGQDADVWLQTGAVRFGDALPVLDDTSMPVPMPLSLHVQKGQSASSDWRNHVVQKIGERAVQLRDGFLDGRTGSTEDARYRPAFESSERTALHGGTARDGFLYSLHALSAGQTFLAPIQFDDAVPAQVRESIRAALGGPLRIGRSRGAEFGRVEGRWVEAPTPPPLADAPIDGVVPILALSDWCLQDPSTGCPSFALAPGMVGLPDGAFVVDRGRTFVRTRAYSPFNAHRRRPDHERQVLVQGSVITVRLGAASLAQVRAAFEGGVGEHRRDGLGRAMVGPQFLQEGRFHGWCATERPLAAGLFEESSLETHPVMLWARERIAVRQGREDALRVARTWRQKLESDFASLPSRSQWGRMRAVALHATTHPALVQSLRANFAPEGDENKGVRHLQSRWGRKARGGASTLGEVLVDLVTKEEQHGLRAARILAALMVRHADGGEP
ncbi:MAG: hypothetical protein KC656_18705 [Myxococcales bacterium]|nr:hypothetical protein [Myxococcales bacterium]